MGTDTSAINEKKEDSKPKETNKNDFKAFGMAVMNSFIHVMVIGIIGANFLYIMSPANLKFLFPEDTSKRPYTDKGPSMFPNKPASQSGGVPSMSQMKEKAKLAKEAATAAAAKSAAKAKVLGAKAAAKGKELGAKAAKSGAKVANKAGFTQVGDMLDKAADKLSVEPKLPPDLCGLDIDPITKSKLFVSKQIQNMYDYGFPYNLKYAKNSNDKSFLGFIENWIGVNVEKSYAGLREVITKILGFMEVICEQTDKGAKWKTLPIFMLAPVLLFVILGLSHLWSIPTVLYYMLFKHETTYDLIFTIVGLFLGWTIFLNGCMTISHSFGIMFAFLILPLLSDGRAIKKIIGKRYHSLYLFILFLLMVTSNAFTCLTGDVALAMFAVFIFVIVSSIRHVINKP